MKKTGRKVEIKDVKLKWSSPGRKRILVVPQWRQSWMPWAQLTVTAHLEITYPNGNVVYRNSPYPWPPCRGCYCGSIRWRAGVTTIKAKLSVSHKASGWYVDGDEQVFLFEK